MFGGLCLESINIFLFHCLITHSLPKNKKRKEKKRQADLHIVIQLSQGQMTKTHGPDSLLIAPISQGWKV